MNQANRAKLAARIAEVAGQALSTRQVVTPVEVVTGIGWLPATQVESWRRGRVAYLERVASANLAKLNTALRLLADWARQHGLTPSETVYVSWTRDRRRLRFTKTGDTHVERAWRTHWISPTLADAKHAQRIRKGTTALDTQTDLAARAGTTQTVISRLERGAVTPTLPLLHRLAGALEGELDLKITGTGTHAEFPLSS